MYGCWYSRAKLSTLYIDALKDKVQSISLGWRPSAQYSQPRYFQSSSCHILNMNEKPSVVIYCCLTNHSRIQWLILFLLPLCFAWAHLGGSSVKSLTSLKSSSTWDWSQLMLLFGWVSKKWLPTYMPSDLLLHGFPLCALMVWPSTVWQSQGNHIYSLEACFQEKESRGAEPVKGALRTVTEHWALLYWSKWSQCVPRSKFRSRWDQVGGVDYAIEKHVGCRILLQPSLENTLYHVNYYKPLRKTSNWRNMKRKKQKIKDLGENKDSSKSRKSLWNKTKWSKPQNL